MGINRETTMKCLKVIMTYSFKTVTRLRDQLESLCSVDYKEEELVPLCLQGLILMGDFIHPNPFLKSREIYK